VLSIVVIEDNDALRAAMVETLRDAGHSVVGVDSAEAMVEEGAAEPADIVVVDVNLPGEDGLGLASRLRAIQPSMGIIVVTGRDREGDRRLGFASGADIFLAKPVSAEELDAAVTALVRRIQGTVEDKGATLRLDMRRRTLVGEAGSVEMRAQEAALLAALVRAPGMQLESWQILEIFERAGWSYTRANASVATFRVGSKLREAGAGPRPIRAIRNWGYRLCYPVLLV
jgi:DNA-binding response OmpR family regulator